MSPSTRYRLCVLLFVATTLYELLVVLLGAPEEDREPSPKGREDGPDQMSMVSLPTQSTVSNVPRDTMRIGLANAKAPSIDDSLCVVAFPKWVPVPLYTTNREDNRGLSKEEKDRPPKPNFIQRFRQKNLDVFLDGNGLRKCNDPMPSERGDPLGSEEKATSLAKEIKSLKVLSTDQVNTLVQTLRSVCAWERKQQPPWEWGDVLRSTGALRLALDCIPTTRLKHTCYHREDFDIFPTFHDLPMSRKEHESGSAVVPIPWKGLAPTTYQRRYRKPWVSITSIVLSCNRTIRRHWMDPARPCHTTLWAVGAAGVHTEKIEAKHRGGRHALWYDREGGFQYGGLLVATNVTHVTSYPGTTVFLPTFNNNNVGHCLHDAFWAFHAVVSSLQGANLPKPYRVMADRDFFEVSCPYLSTLASLTVQTILKKEMVVNPTTDGTTFAHFERLIFTGSDRAGVGSGLPEGRRWAVAGETRRMVFHAIGVDTHKKGTPSLPRDPRIYLYSRRDVHRRSFDNFGEIIESVITTVRQLSDVPDPILITSFSMSPLAQMRMVYDIDVLVTIQGSHLQNSLFMPPDAWIIEICPCRARRVSFLNQFGVFLPKQRHVQVEICAPLINMAGDKLEQNLTLCPHHRKTISNLIQDAVKAIRSGR